MPPFPPQDLIESVVAVAENTADELARSDGREVQLQEDPDLQLPFLLPEDGYSCDVVRNVPNGLQEFLDPLCQRGESPLLRLRSAPRPGSKREQAVPRPRVRSPASCTLPVLSEKAAFWGSGGSAPQRQGVGNVQPPRALTVHARCHGHTSAGLVGRAFGCSSLGFSWAWNGIVPGG